MLARWGTDHRVDKIQSMYIYVFQLTVSFSNTKPYIIHFRKRKKCNIPVRCILIIGELQLCV